MRKSLITVINWVICTYTFDTFYYQGTRMACLACATGNAWQQRATLLLFYKKDYHNAEHMGPCRRLPVLSVTCRLILFYFWTWVCPSLPWIRWYHLGVPPLQPDPRGLESCALLLQPVAAACFSADCALQLPLLPYFLLGPLFCRQGST